ncbi:hypothetical protein EV421DRAFT_1735279 [Armillaria borealis]|uniref:Uncharacterized protein n=1 Tax=Armillaria borealis TaxID=47425 RepID=A0AA39JKM8_9AGAR|nr:hypothetical protein EV421DRAFT_1735279 [Armillaria borealis]
MKTGGKVIMTGVADKKIDQFLWDISSSDIHVRRSMSVYRVWVTGMSFIKDRDLYMQSRAMQKLAQEMKEHITSYIYAKSDLSTLSMVDRSFADACRRVRYATVHLSTGSSFTPLFCAADIQGYNCRCLGTVVSISRAIRYDFPRVGKYIRRIVFFTKYLKRADVLAFVQLMERAPSVTELVFVDTDLGFFKSSLQLLLSSMKILSTLTFKGCSISTQTLNAIVEASPRLTTWIFGCTNDYNITMDEMMVDTHLALADVDMVNMLLDGMLIVTRLDLWIWLYLSKVSLQPQPPVSKTPYTFERL